MGKRAPERAIIADPTAFGTETEVLDLLDSMAVPNVVSDDLAFGDPNGAVANRMEEHTLWE